MKELDEVGQRGGVTALAKVTIPEQIAAALRQDIVTGWLTAGVRLRQVEIAQRFGVSTTPVREAFALLQSDGLVRLDTHRGVTVFLPTMQDLIEHYEIRKHAGLEFALDLLVELGKRSAGRIRGDCLFTGQLLADICFLAVFAHARYGRVNAAKWRHRFHRIVGAESQDDSVAKELSPRVRMLGTLCSQT